MQSKEQILELIKELGFPNADYWTEKEFAENNRAILAMLRFLRPLQKTLDEYLFNYNDWIENIKRCKDDTLKSEITEMIQAGISNETIGRFAYWIARMAFNKVLYRLDDPVGADYDLANEGEQLPEWILKEVVFDDKKNSCVETGRAIFGMFDVFPFYTHNSVLRP